MKTLIPWKRDIQSNDDYRSAPVSQMRWDWDRLFDRFLDDAWSPSASSTQSMLLDITETDEQIRIRAEVPGMDPADLDLSLVGDVLTLSGEKADEIGSENGSRVYSERYFGTYKRAVKLPCPVDVDRVEAKHKNGVVTITLQKSEAVRPKRIEVKST